MKSWTLNRSCSNIICHASNGRSCWTLPLVLTAAVSCTGWKKTSPRFVNMCRHSFNSLLSKLDFSRATILTASGSLTRPEGRAGRSEPPISRGNAAGVGMAYQLASCLEFGQHFGGFSTSSGRSHIENIGVTVRFSSIQR